MHINNDVIKSVVVTPVDRTLNVCVLRFQPPASMAVPGRRRLVPMREPTMEPSTRRPMGKEGDSVSMVQTAMCNV